MSKPKVEFGIKWFQILDKEGNEGDSGYEPYFKIDNQTFSLSAVDTIENAEWMKDNLVAAFMKIKEGWEAQI